MKLHTVHFREYVYIESGKMAQSLSYKNQHDRHLSIEADLERRVVQVRSTIDRMATWSPEQGLPPLIEVPFENIKVMYPWPTKQERLEDRSAAPEPVPAEISTPKKRGRPPKQDVSEDQANRALEEQLARL